MLSAVRSYAITFVSLLACTLLASVAHAENVVDVYRLALQNDSRFRSAQATYRADLQRLPQARAALLPNINAQASATRNEVETETDSGIVSRPEGKATIDSNQFSLSLTQPLYNSALFAGLRQARAEVRRAEAQFAG